MSSDREVVKGYANTAYGQLHYAACGSGEPILLLHQSPRSWDEYRDVLPLLGERFTAVAMDTLGFGASAPAPEDARIEDFASAAIALLDALELPRAHVAGHHTGAVVAMELAAAAPERVDRLVLSSCPWVDEAARARRAAQPPVDAVISRDDGAHLAELWRRRASFYPSGRVDLLHRFVRDALSVTDPEAGHRAVTRYRMEDRIDLVRAPTLLIGAADDPFAYPDLAMLRGALPHAHWVAIPDGGVPLPDQLPEAFATVVTSFLEGTDESRSVTRVRRRPAARGAARSSSR